MRKGKKIYSLIITFDDEKEELHSILETIDSAEDCVECLDEMPDTIICLEDYLEDEWFDIIKGSVIIGFA